MSLKNKKYKFFSPFFKKKSLKSQKKFSKIMNASNLKSIVIFILLVSIVSCNSIDIKGINKKKLLEELWKNQKYASFFTANNQKFPVFDETKIGNQIEFYIDYFQGKAIKCDLSKDFVDPSLYDRDAGEGVFQKSVSWIRKIDAQFEKENYDKSPHVIGLFPFR